MKLGLFHCLFKNELYSKFLLSNLLEKENKKYTNFTLLMTKEKYNLLEKK